MREIISLQVGQAGVQVGNACWELFLAEHGISNDGQVLDKLKTQEEEECLKSWFAEDKDGKYVPRAVLMDLEPTVINEVRNGSFKDFFDPDCIVNGNDGTAGIFARGRYTIGKEMIDI
jgi:tubulin alpha